MSIPYFVIYGLLIFLCLTSLCGLFFFREYVKKISCLSISYSNFLILITLISLKNHHLNEVLIILVTILAIFALNLLIGIGIAKNISETQK